jgi:hypothetical protein
MLISEIDSLFKEVFNEEKGVIKSVETVYEAPKSGEDYLNLIISIHNLSVEDTIIIHTKFIFKTDTQKINVKGNSFNYLYDINCIYHQMNFTDVNDLKQILIKIIGSNKFGKDIQILSEFIDTPGMLLSHYFHQNNITKYSIGNAKYDPKYKIRPCEETTFDFLIEVNDYKITVTISKINPDRRAEQKGSYKLIFKILNDTQEITVDDITNLHFIIGGKLVEILDKFLK